MAPLNVSTKPQITKTEADVVAIYVGKKGVL